LARSFLTD